MADDILVKPFSRDLFNDGTNHVEVEVTFDPPYTQDMMSEVAKLELGFL